MPGEAVPRSTSRPRGVASRALAVGSGRSIACEHEGSLSLAHVSSVDQGQSNGGAGDLLNWGSSALLPELSEPADPHLNTGST
jgi:hypothetical protein